MNSHKKLRLPGVAVPLILTLLSGCGESNKAAPYKPPPLDPRDEAQCYDPGVGDEAITTIAETRVALADCAGKHSNVVTQYNDVRDRMGAEEGPQ